MAFSFDKMMQGAAGSTGGGALESLGSLIGGIFGNVNGAANNEEQKRIIQAMADEYNMDPEAIRQIVAEQQGKSEMSGVNADPNLIASQQRALQGLEGMYAGGGNDAQSQAQMNQINQDVAMQDRARRMALQDRQGRRGGSGGGYASMLQGTQNAATAQANGAYDAHAAAQKRYLDAMEKSGQFAGQMRGQGFDEQAQKAQSQDKINQFNTQLRQNAQIQNQQRDQAVMDARFKRAAGRNAARGQLAGWYGDAGDRARREGLGYGQAAGSFADEAVKMAAGGF